MFIHLSNQEVGLNSRYEFTVITYREVLTRCSNAVRTIILIYLYEYIAPRLIYDNKERDTGWVERGIPINRIKSS